MSGSPVSKSLVLVVGAGVGPEANLPTGMELKEKISEALDIKYDDYRPIGGDLEIHEAFRHLAGLTGTGWQDIGPFIRSSWFIRDAMPLAISIDHFIDAHRGDKNIALCGKLAST